MAEARVDDQEGVEKREQETAEDDREDDRAVLTEEAVVAEEMRVEKD